MQSGELIAGLATAFAKYAMHAKKLGAGHAMPEQELITMAIWGVLVGLLLIGMALSSTSRCY